MASGCTNPAARNYDPSATEDDGSCVYTNNIGGICYAFQDVAVDEIKDKSYTLSWAIEGDNWVFFHDYIPDFYFQTREKLFSLKNKEIWKHNEGPKGTYYGTTKSFFVDVVFNSAEEMTLNSVSWLTEVFTQTGLIEEFSTLSHITIYNSYQSSGRIAMADFTPLPPTGKRKTQSEFSFNQFRDMLINRVGGFLKDVFGNKDTITSAINPNQPWYDQKLFEDNYFVVRFEFDNVGNKSLSLHGVDIEANQSIR